MNDVPLDLDSIQRWIVRAREVIRDQNRDNWFEPLTLETTEFNGSVVDGLETLVAELVLLRKRYERASALLSWIEGACADQADWSEIQAAIERWVTHSLPTQEDES